MSFHFTQICAFIAYSFRFYGLLFVFYRGKDTHFFKVARNWVRFCIFCVSTKDNSKTCWQSNEVYQLDNKPCEINHYTRDSPKYRLPN